MLYKVGGVFYDKNPFFMQKENHSLTAAEQNGKKLEALLVQLKHMLKQQKEMEAKLDVIMLKLDRCLDILRRNAFRQTAGDVKIEGHF